MAQVPKAVQGILASLLALGSLALAADSAAANGIGDVYIAAGTHVLEIQVATQRIVNRVAVSPAATDLAFANSGRTLFISSGTQRLTTVDIASISVSGGIDLPAAAVALAVPLGSTVVAALPALDRVALVDSASGAVTLGDALPGAVNLLAADRRQAQALAASTGAAWIAVIDATSGRTTVSRVEGTIDALAVDRGGTGYVATRNPAQLVAIDLQTGHPRWARHLSADPVAVASVQDGAVVASAHQLWRVTASGAHLWQSVSGTFTAIAASDDGGVLLALEGTTLGAWTVDGTRAVRVSLGSDGPGLALAAMPRPSSLLAPATPGVPAGGATRAGPLPATNVVDEAIAVVRAIPLPADVAGAVAVLLVAALVAAGWSASAERRP